jgi:hypothetical protein
MIVSARHVKSSGGDARGLAMAFKLLELAQDAGGRSTGRIWSRWCVPACGSTRR